MPPQPDWNAIREEFPALAGCTYLNTATYGQTPNCAVRAAVQHFERRNALACADFLEWFDDADGIRHNIATLIGAHADDIAFVPNASTALAWLFNGLRWNPGDRILSLAGEFPNNLYFPALLAAAGVEFIEAEWDAILDHVDDRARVVLVSTVNYTTGFRPPLEELSQRLHQTGGLLYVDGTQSVGALQFDVQRVQPDMLAVHGYKWLLSPNGAGFAYVAPPLRTLMQPTVVGWRSHRGWREVDELHHGMPEFNDAAERYEGGMLNFPSLYSMGAVVEMMLGIGPAAIQSRVMTIAGSCSDQLRSAGADVAHLHSPIISARFPGVDTSQLALDLRRRGIHVSARHGALRVSTHFYNNDADLQRMSEALGALL